MTEPSTPTSPEPADETPPAPADETQPTPERPIPRGCNPLVFGVVMATIQFGLTVYFMGWC